MAGAGAGRGLRPLAWYREKLGFEVCQDESGKVPGFRWLTVAPAGSHSTQLILMLPQEDADQARIGANGRCVLASDDIAGDVSTFRERGVRVLDGPTEAPWGTTATIADLYGNPYYLVQARAPA